MVSALSDNPVSVESMLVIGYGNPLRGDDGVGFHVAHLLMESAMTWNVIACHQLTLDLVDPIQRADFVVFVDASIDVPVGEIVIRPLEPFAHPVSLWTHQVDAELLLTLTLAWYRRCPRAVLVGVGAMDFGLSEHLSPLVEARVPQIIETLREFNRNSS